MTILRSLLVCVLAGCSVPSVIDLDATAGGGDAGTDDAPPATPLLSIAPDQITDFDGVTIGGTSAAVPFTLLNTGAAASGVITVALDDTGAGFALSTDGCSGAPLAAGGTCVFAVRFQPAIAGAALAHVRVTATPGGSLERAFQGRGVERGAVDVVEPGHDFASVHVGEVQDFTFDVTNSGQATIATPVATIGGTNADSYAIQSTTCISSLGAGAHCAVKVRFAPTVAGAKVASLTVTAGTDGVDTAGLGGTSFAHVTVDKSGDGSGRVASNLFGLDCGPTCGADFTSSPVTLTATAEVDSTFAGWSNACTGAACALDLTGDRQIVAQFTADPRLLTVVVDGSGSVRSTPAAITCPGTCMATFPFQTPVTLTATAAAGWAFLDWQGACTNVTGTCMVTMDQARTVTARFAGPQPLTIAFAGTGSGRVQSAPSGLDCVAPCNATFAPGTVTLTATGTNGSTFTRWNGGGCNTSPTCVVTLTAPTSITASFAAGPQILHVDTRVGDGTGTVNVVGVGMCSSVCDFSIAWGQTINVEPIVPANWGFTGWGGACTGTGQCIFGLTGPRTVTASFVRPRTLAVHITGTGSVITVPSGVTCAGNLCTASFARGQQVTVLPSGPFLDWSGPAAAQCQFPDPTTCILHMDTDLDLTASFQ